MKKLLPPRDTYFYSSDDCAPNLIVGGKNYFSQLKQAFEGAKKTVYICGWSFNLKTILDDNGTTVEEVLFSLPETVEVKILIWDYIIFYMADRDPFLPLHIASKNRKNIQFERFDFHPVMSSMHAKMVIVDEKILFMGGIDIDLGRRDGPYNLGNDPVRREKDGKVYSAFRDYAFRFEGKCGLFFSGVFEQLWSSQKKQRSKISSNHKASRADRIYFSRTVPKFKNNPKDASSFLMHKWLISTAREYIYIENQYLTSEKIVDALVKKLKEPRGPEVVIVVAYGNMPILEKVSMGALLTECSKRLLRNDPFGRLKIYTLVNGEGSSEEYIKIHSKLLMVDDRFLKVGSSNINNRSMEFDYELDSVVEGDIVKEYKKEIFSTLLGNGGEVGIFNSVIETFEEGRRKYGKVLEVKHILHGESTIADFKEYLPLDKRGMSFFERMGQMLIGKKVLAKLNLKVFLGAMVLALILGGAFFIDVDETKAAVDQMMSWLNLKSGFSLMILFYVGYLILGAFFFPLNAYIFLCGAYFETAEAFFLAIAGALSSSTVSYGIGALFKGEIKADTKIEKVNQLRRLLKRNSLKTLVFLRMLPVAPFPLVNLVCGKFGVVFWKYFLGTLIGIAPGCYVLIFMEKRLIDLIQSPNPKDLAVILAMVALGLIAAKFVKKRMSA